MRRKPKTFLKVISATCLLISIFSIASPINQTAYAKQESVNVWVTTPDQSKLLNQESDISFTSEVVPKELTINVNEKKTYQQMEGFGAAMTDSSAWLISQMNAGERNKLMKSLFDHTHGIGISYLRVPMGSSDFALSNYTYNDLPAGETDHEMTKFSIEHDEKYIIPTLKNALKWNPDVKLMGTPWSPPAWMKTSGSLIKGTLKEDSYQAYAKYFTSFIKAYKKEGLPIDAVTIQNEPHHEPSGYPGMLMNPEEQSNFIKKNLGPMFESKKIDTKILAWDHNWDEYDYPIEVLNDPEAKKYIAGAAFHGYAGDVQNQQYVHDAHPDKDIYFTESSGGEWAKDFGGNLQWDIQNLIIGTTRNWAKTVLKWNLALDEKYGPTNGGCMDCRGIVTINQETGSVDYNVEYYAFGHASKFVKPGAYRIDSNTFGSGSIEDVAFKNPDGSKVLIALNSSKEAKSFNVRWGKKAFSYNLPAGAVATFVWSGKQAGETFISPYSKIQAEDYSAVSGLKTEVAIDSGGGKFTGHADNGDYLLFKNVEFVDGTVSLNMRVATENKTVVELRTGRPDGKLIGSLDISNTGGWQSWKTKTAEITGARGIQDLYVVFKGAVNVNWLQFSKAYFADSFNYLSNNGDFEQGDLSMWSGWDSNGNAQFVDTESPRGKYKLTHWGSSDYMQTTYQTVNVPNGTYRASVWVRKDTGNNIQLEVKKYGGKDLKIATGTDGIGDWKQLFINGIKVTNGQLEIGVFSDSPAGKWAAFDDFELHPVTTIASESEEGENAPDTPEIGTAVAGESGTIELSWEKVDGAKGYAVYRSIKTEGGTEAFAERTLTTEEGFTDYGLTSNVTYFYRIAAFNETGESAASTPQFAVSKGEDKVAPAAPSGLIAKPGIEKMLLYWNPNVEKDFLRYHIYQDGALVGSLDPVTETSFIINGLTDIKEYQYVITAVDRAGNESTVSSSVTAAPIPVGTPVPFANNGFENGTLEGWSEWHPDGQNAANSVDADSPREGGSYKLTHWSANAYQQTTYRTVQVPNGTYRLTVWARSGGGQNTFRLEASDYGGPALYQTMLSAEGGKWTQFSIENINVTNGQLRIGVYSEANAGNWAAIDDFELVTY
ncbi:carbohydrate-binding protein [Bacillus infantis]|uniref:carbohydrate-binding protein n=1 Tax=Bacillus infantis TaxID=324767 RepID=UPI001CD31F09|nr:carbohydrate-binding protein [Bacillus infantis]MCA1036608.1 carbohydrate-binding protein [Bacillus infantis]